MDATMTTTSKRVGDKDLEEVISVYQDQEENMHNLHPEKCKLKGCRTAQIF